MDREAAPSIGSDGAASRAHAASVVPPNVDMGLGAVPPCQWMARKRSQGIVSTR